MKIGDLDSRGKEGTEDAPELQFKSKLSGISRSWRLKRSKILTTTPHSLTLTLTPLLHTTN